MIKTEKGDLWAYEKTHLLVVPTNIGWKSNGKNVMGRGLALQASGRYPELPQWYGGQCRRFGAVTPVLRYPDGPLILFPVKTLNEDNPAMSWKHGASLVLIERSARQLSELRVDRPVAVSLVGCGNGGLGMGDVRPILDHHLSDNRFTLILPDHSS